MAESSHRSNGNYSQRKPYSRGNGNLKTSSKEDDEPPPQRDYFYELGDPRYNPIPRCEEAILAEMVSGGDESARIRLIRANLRFVVREARRYLGQGLPLIDLVSAGYEGLIDSVEGFDYRLGFKFITYAVKGIRHKIEEELRERRNGKAISLDTILGETHRGQIPSPDPTPSDDVEREETYLLLQEALAELDERDRRVLNLRYYEEFNEREIAEIMGVSPARINQRKMRALEKLRENLNI